MSCGSVPLLCCYNVTDKQHSLISWRLILCVEGEEGPVLLTGAHSLPLHRWERQLYLIMGRFVKTPG